MKKILFTLLALVGLACANAAETINVVSIEENFYVPSDAQYEPYYRCDMFEYYDYTSVKFVRTVTPAGKVNITA